MSVPLEIAEEFAERLHEMKHNRVGNYIKKELNVLGGAERWAIPYRTHETNDEWGVAIPPGYEDGFTQEELDSIKLTTYPPYLDGTGSRVYSTDVDSWVSEDFEDDAVDFQTASQSSSLVTYFNERVDNLSLEINSDASVVNWWDFHTNFTLGGTPEKYNFCHDIKELLNSDYDLKQGTPTNRPPQGTKTVDAGSFNIARFNDDVNVDHELFHNFSASHGNLDNQWTVMIAMRIQYETTERVLWQGRDSNGELRCQLDNGIPKLTFQWGSSHEISLAGLPSVDGKWQEFAWGRRSDGTSFLRVWGRGTSNPDGTEVTFADGNLSFTKFRLGNNSNNDNGANVDVLEMLVANTDLTNKKLRRYRRYLKLRRFGKGIAA